MSAIRSDRMNEEVKKTVTGIIREMKDPRISPMTTLTTVLGLIVMAAGGNIGTKLIQPMALVCIGGLLYGTVMTLFVVPCIYDIMNRKPITGYCSICRCMPLQSARNSKKSATSVFGAIIIQIRKEPAGS